MTAHPQHHTQEGPLSCFAWKSTRVRAVPTQQRSHPNSPTLSASSPANPSRGPQARPWSWTVFDPALAALAGTHRIQRVPVTEKRGRRHSSEVTVVVLDPAAHTSQPSRIRPEDVRVDTFRSSGAGGQHRNKTDSGVRLTHLPTGVVVTATEERSQHQNRTVAWERLIDRLHGAAAAAHHETVNGLRQETLAQGRSWTWTGWRDEVKGPNGQRAVMSRALNGRLSGLLK